MMFTKRTPLGFTIMKEETALVRIDKIADEESGYCDVRFIDLELGTSDNISILQSSDIFKKLNEYDIAKVLRQKVELDFGTDIKETGWQTYIYPSVPVISTYQLDKLRQEYESDTRKLRQSIYLTIFGIPLGMAITILIVFAPALFAI